MKDDNEEFREISLCAGYGGIGLGLSLLFSCHRTVCYVEREAFPAAHLVKKMEEGTLAKASIWSDIKSFDGRPWRSKVHIITAGFPCQPHSSAGKKKGTADDRWIWPDIARIICEAGPVTVFIENVRGLVRSGLAVVLSDLTALGYNIIWGCFKASDIQAPHKRDRLFILGHSQSCNWSIPEIKRQNNSEFRRTSKGMGVALGNAHSKRLERWCDRPKECRGKITSRKTMYQVDERLYGFPPGRGVEDYSKWLQVFRAGYWFLAPALPQSIIRQLVNGRRIDSLRTLGNGCVPHQVAYAFAHLSIQLFKERWSHAR